MLAGTTPQMGASSGRDGRAQCKEWERPVEDNPGTVNTQVGRWFCHPDKMYCKAGYFVERARWPKDDRLKGKQWEPLGETMGASRGKNGSVQWILMGASNGSVIGFYLQHGLFFPEGARSRM